MNPIEEALDKAFAAQVANLFNVLLTAVNAAGSDEAAKQTAQSRFREGLDLAIETLSLAKESVGIN